MASPSDYPPNNLPPFQRLVTTHDKNGKSMMSDALSVQPEAKDYGPASFLLGYVTGETPVDMNGDKDIGVFKKFVDDAPGLVVSTGSVLRFVDFPPGLTSAMHRTVSIDYGLVLIGEVELEVESGEKRIMKPGDICIQRGTHHSWKNVSTTEWARMMFVLLPCKPIEVGGQTLGEDHGPGIPGVKASS